MPARAPEEVWKELVLEAGEDEIDHAASLTVSQAEADLAQAGFDVRAERAVATAILTELAGEAPSSRTGHETAEPSSAATAWVSGAPPPQRRAPSAQWALLLAATLAAAATGGALYALAHRPKPNDKPDNVPPVNPSTNVPAPRAPEPGGSGPSPGVETPVRKPRP